MQSSSAPSSSIVDTYSKKLLASAIQGCVLLLPAIIAYIG
jgi:hypothetical protein